jgi:DNA polymerase IV
MGLAFIEVLAVDRFHGVGPVTAAKMNRLGIFTGADLKAQTQAFLQEQFGKAGLFFYGIPRGIDDRPVCANRSRKSLGTEKTFSRDLVAREDMQAELRLIVDRLWRHCEAAGIRGRTVTLKVKYADFQIMTRCRSDTNAVPDQGTLMRVSLDLLAILLPAKKGVRLLGISLSSLQSEHTNTSRQMTLAL